MNRGKGRDSRDCFHCGKRGHVQRECRTRIAQENAASGRGLPSSSTANGANGVSWSELARETIMEIEIEGKKFHCLLDLGCDHSLIPRSMLPDDVPLLM